MRVKVDLSRLHNLAEAARQRAEASSSQQRRDGRSWYKIENKTAERAEIYVYDMIGEWGVSAQDFVGELRTVRSQAIDLHINSEGGEVFDGLAIYEAVRQHPAGVTVYVDGLAASAASFIAMAGDRIIMAERARLMIHDAHGFAIGNAADMREMAALLDDLSDNIADIYAERAGGSRQQWRDVMRGAAAAADGTWYDAQAAVEAGLADEVAAGRQREGADEPAVERRAEDRGPSGDGRPRADAPPPTSGEVAAWDPAAFVAMFQEAENPPEPVAIPTATDLLDLFKTA